MSVTLPRPECIPWCSHALSFGNLHRGANPSVSAKRMKNLASKMLGWGSRFEPVAFCHLERPAIYRTSGPSCSDNCATNKAAPKRPNKPSSTPRCGAAGLLKRSISLAKRSAATTHTTHNKSNNARAWLVSVASLHCNHPTRTMLLLQPILPRLTKPARRHTSDLPGTPRPLATPHPCAESNLETRTTLLDSDKIETL